MRIKWSGPVVISLFAVLLVAVSLYNVPRQNAPDAYAGDKVFSDLIMQAETWSVCMMNPPDAYRGKSDIPGSVLQEMHNSQIAQVNRIFTGSYKRSAQEIVEANFNNANYKLAYGGGVNWIRITSLTIAGNSAVANVYVSKYLEVKVPKGYAKTQGTGNDIFSFSLDDGQWKISNIGGPGPIGNNVTTITPSP
jgi:hypothetical protein